MQRCEVAGILVLLHNSYRAGVKGGVGVVALSKRELFNSMLIAFFAQGVALLVSIAQTLIVPKILGVEQFAYWQLFVFYIGYVGFFHLGLSSGVYLKMGGKLRGEFDKSSTKSQFIFGMSYQVIMSLVIAAIGFGMPEQDRGFVLIQTSIYLVLANACTYLMNVLQCMNETKKSSYSVIIGKVAYFIPLLLMMTMGVRDFRPYIVAFTASIILQLAYCLWELRDFVRAPLLSVKTTLHEGFDSIKVGSSLMLANIASTLILGVSRFIIDGVWGIEAFGKLSLMFSIVSFFLLFVNQVGLVLFPALRTCGQGEMASFYEKARSCLSVVLPIIYILYFPVQWFVGMWLPDYADALPFLAILLPICLFESIMGTVGNTYFQVNRKEKKMLCINMYTAILSAFLSVAGAYVFNSIKLVILGPSIAVAARSVFADKFVSDELGMCFASSAIGEILISLIFVISTAFLSDLAALLVVVSGYALYLFACRDRVSNVVVQLSSFVRH